MEDPPKADVDAKKYTFDIVTQGVKEATVIQWSPDEVSPTALRLLTELTVEDFENSTIHLSITGITSPEDVTVSSYSTLLLDLAYLYEICDQIGGEHILSIKISPHPLFFYVQGPGSARVVLPREFCTSTATPAEAAEAACRRMGWKYTDVSAICLMQNGDGAEQLLTPLTSLQFWELTDRELREQFEIHSSQNKHYLKIQLVFAASDRDHNQETKSTATTTASSELRGFLEDMHMKQDFPKSKNYKKNLRKKKLKKMQKLESLVFDATQVAQERKEDTDDDDQDGGSTAQAPSTSTPNS
eukprot:TRINITY_DN1581_c0_g1_i1.p1 TRINITY_DN1581_c0_g1~~TRINITY_DN1581_c0_g1_i1.p1  ORF type:complete len:300 (-),score=57.55 TRINITY_DN1581_c0_g1_i1:137-1036(-)